MKHATIRFSALSLASSLVLLAGCGGGNGANPGDTSPPAAVTDLAFDTATDSSVTVVWTAPGDDADSGKASSYDIRYSATALSEATWDSAVPASGEPAPAPAGQLESFTIGGLMDSAVYSVALKTADEESNLSSLSNVVACTTHAAGPEPIYLGCEYFPLAVGDTWVYDTGSAVVSDTTHRFADGEGRRLDGQLDFQADPDILFLNCIDGDFVFLGQFSTGDGFTDDPVNGAAIILRHAMRVGDRWSMPLAAAPADSLVFEVLGTADVTVSAGTFDGCLRIRFTLGTPGNAESYTDEYYYARNVGIVRAERIAPTGHTEGFFLWVNSEHRTAELQSATVGGVSYP